MIELLAVLVILVLLLATFVPYALSLREVSNRARCVDRLVSIRKALDAYGENNRVDNRVLLPRVRFDPVIGNAWTAFTGPDDSNPFTPTSHVAPNDVSASLWLLVREGYAQPEWFVCPSSGGEADAMLDANGGRVAAKMRGNFRAPSNLTYGLASPFSTIEEYRWNQEAYSSRFALIADQAPRPERFAVSASIPRFDASRKAQRAINSPNHHGDGQNVLFADGSVSFEVTPYCGVGGTLGKLDGDNIYTALAPNVLTDAQPKHNEPGVVGRAVGPAYRYDSVLVPGADFHAD